MTSSASPLRLLAATLLLGCCGLASAFDIAPFTADYSFNIDNKLSGTATRTLEKRGNDSWHYVFTASAPLASASETSDFRYDGRTVTSLSYRQKRRIFFIHNTLGVDFDWKKNTATGFRGDNVVSYGLKPDTLDTLNMEVQVRRDLMDLGKLGGPYWLGSPKDISPLPLEIEGEEILDTPLGKLTTLRVSRKHDSSKRHTTMWLAKSLDYLPVKVMQNDNGAVYLIEITAYHPAQAAAAK